MPAKPAVPRKPLKISPMLLALLGADKPAAIRREIVPPQLPPGVVPAVIPADAMALDSQTTAPYYAWANQLHCGLGFPGYAYLSELAQQSEFRSPSETIATEMTRKWIKIISHGKGDVADKIEQIEEAFKEFKVQDLFRKMAQDDGFFGRAQLYIKIKGQDNDQGRKRPLIVDEATVKKGSLLGFAPVEAIWTTPYNYNSNDPTQPYFFTPESWFVLGKQTHATRMLTFIAREVPDLLKPAYNFGGLSMSQLMEPYVKQWLRTRDAVSDLIYNFSISGIMTNMQATLEGSSDGILQRMELFTRLRNNKGLMLLDKDSEEFFQFNTPLSGLHELQEQAQEHMSAPCHIPLVKLLGITPSGLNASSEGEIQVFYDFVRAHQGSFYTPNLTIVLNLIQLHLFGAIDKTIGFEYVPLDEPTPTELGAVRKSDADAGVAYINAGVISPQEERERLMGDPNSGYDNLSGEAPPPPLEAEHELNQEAAQADHERDQESAAEAHKRDMQVAKAKPRGNAADEWNESLHPRADNGRFGVKSTGTENPAKIEPVNAVDPEKVNAIAASMKRDGWQGRPVMYWNGPNGKQALTGSHRLAAAKKAGIDADVYEVDGLGDFEDSEGRTITDIEGNGKPEDLVAFLKEFGDSAAAKLAQAEIDANDQD